LLQDGTKAQDIAIIVPSHVQARVLEALAREYSLTLAPESLGGLLETPSGRVLEAALSAPTRDYPAKELRTLSALEPELSGLSDALEARGLHGGSASYTALIDDTAQLEAFSRIKTWIEPPEFASIEALIDWFERLLERIAGDAAWLQSARVIARETARLLHQDADTSISGVQFSDWLRTLLQAVAVAHPDVGRGVALLAPEEASGRRFAHVFVLFAVDGAYRRLEGEDFFVPEDDRIALEALLRGANALPEQMSGLGDSALYDVLTRANQTTHISFPRAERGASHTMHPRLLQLGLTVQPEFRRTAGPLEYAHTFDQTSHNNVISEHRVESRQGPFDAYELEDIATCGLRAWAKRHFPKDAQTSLVPSAALETWRRTQRRENLAGRFKTPRDTAPEALALERFDPTFAAMLEESIEQQPMIATQIQQPFERTSNNIRFMLDGLRRENHADGKVKRLEVYRIVETLEDGFAAFRSENRHREWWFADIAMQSGVNVSFHALDAEGNSKFVMNPGGEKSQKRMLEARAALDRAQSELEQGVLKATTGFHCYNCGFKDLCREST
jgi:ATP-dependent helicase/nuclease subunit B